MAASPVLLLLYPIDFKALNWFCAILFAIAALTDILDGYIARSYNLESTFGALLDPIADKILAASALILLVHARLLPPLFGGLLIARDIWVSGVRLLSLERGQNIPVSPLGKIKTIVQDIAIFLLLTKADYIFDLPVRTIGLAGICGAIILAGMSAYFYTKLFLDSTKQI